VHEKEFAEIGVDEQSQPIQLLSCSPRRAGYCRPTASARAKGDTPAKTRVRRLRALLQGLIDHRRRSGPEPEEGRHIYLRIRYTTGG